jgi:hypothetical protein
MKNKENKLVETNKRLKEFILNDPERKLRINTKRTEYTANGWDILRGFRINFIKQLHAKDGYKQAR